MHKSDDPATASSKTYRVAVKKLAKTIGVRPSHSRYPRDDFEDLLDEVDERSKKRAMKWYERGIKRGISFATDQVLDGTFHLAGKTLTAPKQFTVSVRFKFSRETWRKRSFTIKAKDVGFSQ